MPFLLVIRLQNFVLYELKTPEFTASCSIEFSTDRCSINNATAYQIWQESQGASRELELMATE